MEWLETKLARRFPRASLIAEHRYFQYVAPVRHAERRREPAPLLDDWVASLGTPSRVVVVGAGPTAAGLPERPDVLHVATNSSERAVADQTYAYFLSESHPIDRYVKTGPRSPNCKGTFFRFESRGVSDGYRELAQRTQATVRKWQRDAPEIVAGNGLGEGPELANFEVFEGRILDRLGDPVKQYNSGFGALYLGFFLAVSLDVPLEIYGLDAGMGGAKHFDGSKMASPSVIGDRVRTKLTELHGHLQAQTHVPVTNHSAFLPYG